jgi:hypothetical protein
MISIARTVSWSRILQSKIGNLKSKMVSVFSLFKALKKKPNEKSFDELRNIADSITEYACIFCTGTCT